MIQALMFLAISLINNMKPIPAGSFMMGCSADDIECDDVDDEMPRYNVNIEAFSMLESEVTWDMYQPCVNAGVCFDTSDAGFGRGSWPVINISIEDIVGTYIPWLNEKTGLKFRLPSEAEWEYAARGQFHALQLGISIGNNRANCNGCGSRWDTKQTAPVKTFSPSVFGLYDMHGNVPEWTAVYWNVSYNGAPTDGSVWQRCDSRWRVDRGGSWSSLSHGLRASFRNGIDVIYRYSVYGFRLAQD